MRTNDLIRMRRLELDMTMKELAAKVGVSSFQIKKPRKTPNTASYGVFYCRQRGSNPHRILMLEDVGRCCAKWCSKPIKKRAEPLPRPYREKRSRVLTFFSHYHLSVFIKDVVSTPILSARLCIFKDRKRALLRVGLRP